MRGNNAGWGNSHDRYYLQRFFIFETYEFSSTTAEVITLVVVVSVMRNTCARTSGIGIRYMYYVFQYYGYVNKHFRQLVHGTLSSYSGTLFMPDYTFSLYLHF